MPRDRRSASLAADSFSLCFQRYLGVEAGHTVIFMMPKRTRVTMARLARSGLQRIGLVRENLHFAMPLPARPDRVRVRAGLTYRAGLRGAVERHVSRPLMIALQERLVDAQAVESAITKLIPAAAHENKVFVFGSLSQLHAVASFLLDGGRTITLTPGSLLGTSGLLETGEGDEEAPGKTRADMREDLRQAFRLTNGEPAPISDVYGVAEADWAAMQCAHGSYHIPPWVHAVTVSDEDKINKEPRSTGLLAFFDPSGAGSCSRLSSAPPTG